MGKITFNKQRLARKYRGLPPDTVRWYLSSFPHLMKALKNNKHTLNILLIYLFIRVELAQHRILYFVMIEKYKLDEKVVRKKIDALQMNRDQFVCLYEIVVGKPMDKETDELGVLAQQVRNPIMHGRYEEIDTKTKEDAIVSIFDYSVLLNTQAHKDIKELKLEFEPFGKKENFKAEGDIHSEEVSKNIIKEMFDPLKKMRAERDRQKNAQ